MAVRVSRFLAGLLLLALLISGCAARQVGLTRRIEPGRAILDLSAKRQKLTSWADLKPALESSLAYVRRQHASESVFGKGGLDTPCQVTWKRLERGLLLLLELLPRLEGEPELLRERFIWVPVNPDVLLTGYYEPYLEASLAPRPDYPYPLYAMPADVKKGRPYYSRADIDFNGALKGRGLEIAWAKDLVDIFFLQVQGSGRLLLPDGQEKHILYAGTNQHPYVSLGKKLVERGYAPKEKMSMRKIRDILAENPEQREELLSLNPKYIFFQLKDTGPYGSTGAVLTPMVSVAVDRTYIPYGSALMVRGDLPDGHVFNGLVLAQDTGTMKRNHLDLFCGAGPEAAGLAGRMRGRAAAWMLLPR